MAGWIAAQFRDYASPCFIDDKTIAINLGGSPSSTGYKAQANIIPASIPGCTVEVSSMTWAGLRSGVTWHGGKFVLISAGTILFADGTSIDSPVLNPMNTTGNATDGTWYFSVGLVLSTLQAIYYLSMTAPTETQLAAFYADGVIPLCFNQSFVIAAGGHQLYSQSTTRRHTL
jgi:hypothetical protein